MNLVFLGKNASDETVDWSEFLIQSYIVQEARRANLMVLGGAEQGQRSKSSGGRLKASGMTAGHTDLTMVLDDGKVIWIELKTAKGKVSQVQKEHHEKLKKLGHAVYVVFAKSPLDGWNQVKNICKLFKK